MSLSNSIQIIFALIVCGATTAPAFADAMEIKDEGGNSFMEEDPTQRKDPPKKQVVLPRDFSNVGISTDPEGHILPSLNRSGAPVQQMYSQVQMFNELPVAPWPGGTYYYNGVPAYSVGPGGGMMPPLLGSYGPGWGSINYNSSASYGAFPFGFNNPLGFANPYNPYSFARPYGFNNQYSFANPYGFNNFAGYANPYGVPAPSALNFRLGNIGIGIGTYAPQFTPNYVTPSYNSGLLPPLFPTYSNPFSTTRFYNSSLVAPFGVRRPGGIFSF